jgi:DNA-directed RNA polymerase subunit N (RpoN/RPB10)
MRSIERLRGGSRRVGPELVNGERETILTGLASEVDALDSHLGVERHCCHEMQTTIAEMQTRVKALKRLAAQQREAGKPTPDEQTSS